MKYLNYLKSFGKKFSYQTWFILTITFMMACNNKGTGENNNDSTAITQNADTTKKQLNALGTSEFSYLTIADSVLENIFITPPAQGGLNSRKIVFRFTYDGGADDQMELTGFPTRSGNNNYLAPFDPVEAEPYVANFANQRIYLSDLELEKNFFKNTIWPKKGTNTHLLLIPFVHNSGTFQYCVNYSLNWITLAGYTGETFAPGDELNPSPPADPK